MTGMGAGGGGGYQQVNGGIGEGRGQLPQGNSLVKGSMSTGQLLRLKGSGYSKPHGTSIVSPGVLDKVCGGQGWFLIPTQSTL